MAGLSAAEIYRYARQAGFGRDQAVTMTAIAMAESGGNPQANAVTPREDSRGLWQINMHAHADKFGLADLYDPEMNAFAAFTVSGGGKNFRPWSVYTNGRYFDFLGQAQTAAGQVDKGLLIKRGKAGKRKKIATGPTAEAIIAEAKKHVGASYSAAPGQRTWSPDVANPSSFDCSGFFQYLVRKIIDPGMAYDVSNNQLRISEEQGLGMSVEEAINTPGALLFKVGEGPDGHVAMSLGNGDTIESYGGNGVGIVTGGARQSYYTKAARIPGLEYGVQYEDEEPVAPGQGISPVQWGWNGRKGVA